MPPAAPPVAIVAATCEFPDAAHPAALWELSLARRRCFRRLPPERLRLDEYAREAGDNPDGIYAIEAALLEGYHFDRALHRVPQSSFQVTDMAHWLALDVAGRLIRQVGGTGLGDDTAVIVANTLTGEFSRSLLLRGRWPYVERVVRRLAAAEGLDPLAISQHAARFEELFKSPFPEPNEDSLAGGLANTIAGRICNHFGLRGGGYTVDGACASSLVALASACERLQTGGAQSVLVGAVDLSLDPFELIGFARNGALSRSTMRVFDQASDGFWPGEGCAFLLLATIEAVEAHNWPVLGWIRGWGQSTDGQGGLTRPGVDGQRLALTRAYARAGLAPGAVDYFEAHGTGTPTGDPVELVALTAVLEGSRGPAIPIGSVKANIGHTKAAAGLAGVVKALGVLANRTVPPLAGLRQPHDLFSEPTVAGRLRLPLDSEPIGHARPVIAGVNAFGFGGINCHVVLEAACGAPGTAAAFGLREIDVEALPGELLLLCAPDRASLRATVEQIQQRCATLSRAEMCDLCAFWAMQPAQAWRAWVTAQTPQELEAAAGELHAALGSDLPAPASARSNWGTGQARSEFRLGLLFPGQGQNLRLRPEAWARRFPLLHTSACRVTQLLAGDATDTAVAQPLLAEASIAALALLEQCGLRADVVLGHSFGEVAAAHAAGVFDARALRLLAAERGRLMSTVSGSMVAVHVDREQALKLAAAFGLDLACENAAQRHVLAGAVAPVAAALAEALRRGFEAVLLPTRVPFHSRLLAPLAAPFEQVLGTLELHEARLPLASTVDGAQRTDAAAIAHGLAAQFHRPVRFHQALRGLPVLDLLLEVGPGHSLTQLAPATTAIPVRALDVLGERAEAFLCALGTAWALGADLDVGFLWRGRQPRSFDPGRAPSFLGNACELLEPPSGATELLPRRAPRSEAPLEPARAGDTALSTLRQEIAQSTGLPLSAIDADARLLADLHLNSIRVRHLASRTARSLGIQALPQALGDPGSVTVAELAERLEGLRQEQGESAQAVVTGVDTWLRSFEILWQAQALTGPATHIRFVLEGDGQWLPTALRARLLGPESESGAKPRAMVYLAGEHPQAQEALALLSCAKRFLAEPQLEGLLILQRQPLHGGFARCLAREVPQRRICVVDLPRLDETLLERALQAYALAPRGLTELRVDASAQAWGPGLRPLGRSQGRVWLPSPGDVVLVTGGARGIGAETALHLGRRYGCSLALLGRSPPNHLRVRDTLARLHAEAIPAAYAAADLRDADATRTALNALERTLGPINALFHAAGSNEPTEVARLEPAVLLATLANKAGALDTVLAFFPVGHLRLLVSYGSIIGSLGMVGEAHYAQANEWLNARVQAYRETSPATVCIPLCWTAWKSAGMAVTLDGVLDGLAQSDTRALETDEALSALDELMHRGDTQPVLVAGRHGRPAPDATAFDAMRLRYLEEPRVHYPGVELIVDSVISTDTDVHLRDHAPFGIPVLPTVSALEAMLQGANALCPAASGHTVEDLHIEQPVAFSAGERCTLRLALLADTDGEIRAQVRASTTAFDVPHFHARVVPRGSVVADPLPPLPGPKCAAAAVYEGLLFHGPSFRCVQGYDNVQALGCEARLLLGQDTAQSWFSPFLPRASIGGEAALRDGLLHALQACIPQFTVLPAAAMRILPGHLRAGVDYRLRARETASDGSEYHWDLDLATAEGEVVEQWRGLRLRRVVEGARESGASLHPDLLVAFVQRLAIEGAGYRGLRAGVGRGADRRDERALAALEQALGPAATLQRRANGAPWTPGHAVSLSHAGEFTLLTGSAEREVSCDLQFDPGFNLGDWRHMLGALRTERFTLLARRAGLALELAALHLWVATECLEKLGVASWPLDEIEPRVLHTRLGLMLCFAGPSLQVITADLVLGQGGQRCAVGIGLGVARALTLADQPVTAEHLIPQD